ncbi:sigma-70 family RNA polymerase sigma factor [Variovorax sp. LT2P21]|uniref:sigma-70 family RNA polymerase sigma factor n=1 Tax=Variovorax sp. LT2P21 TaxID=3443731 RepID=UPI003F45BFC4
MSEPNVAGARPLSQFFRMAILAGVESAVQIHIDRGDDLDARDTSGMTPLMLTAAQNKPAICRLLLSAGADHRLLDPSGKTAFEIALAADSHATAAVLSAARAPAPTAPLTDDAARPFIDDAEPGARSLVPLDGAIQLATMADGWEEEVAAPVIPDDPAIWEAAKATKVAMANHVPIDTWSDWGDLSAYLPDRASFLPATDDPEARARLRRLFLRALREGSAPDDEVVEVSRDPEDAQDLVKASVYRMVMEDMGCETDERLERREAFEDHNVYVDPDETPEEEDALTDALAHIGTLTSTQFDPFYLYQREAQRHRLLRAEDEVEIGQAMEASLESALDALAAWPDGISRLLDAAKAVQAGDLPTRWLCAGPRQEAPVIDDEGIDADPVAAAPETETPTSAVDHDAEGDPSSGSKSGISNAEFFVAAQRLSAVAIDTDRNSPHWSEARSLLASMHVASNFLLDLADEAPRNSSEAACAFKRDMEIHRRHRDRMAISNLKLVMFQAKRYMRFDLPLSDLVQEGNIGLLRAVDKFDWRRGFRFSTYALWWVRQGITRFIADNGRTIRLPVHVFDEVQRLRQESRLFEERMGRAPELSEIAPRLGIAERNAAALMRVALTPSSLDDADIDASVDPSLSHGFIDPDPMEKVAKLELDRAVNRALKILEPKAERIIRQRFGLGGLAEHTLDEIGVSIGVTRERVRQIESKALDKLRHPTCAGLLDPSRVHPRSEGQQPPADAVDGDSARPAPTDPMTDALAVGPLRMVPVAVNKALELAMSLRAPVEDDRLGSTGRIWVRTDDNENSHMQILIPKLVGLGFAHEAGKGCWR